MIRLDLQPSTCHRQHATFNLQPPMYPLFRSLLFRLDPEAAHTLTLYAIRFSGMIPPASWLIRQFFAAPPHPVTAFGLTFPNPVGLAAGYDKDGLGWRGLACLGFGHIEIGTVTPRPQPGNPKPRLFRLIPERGVINRMGFPGRGADFVAERLKVEEPALSLSKGSKVKVGNSTLDPVPSTVNRQPLPILGVNIGKNKDTPLEAAASDYVSLVQTFAPLADYLAVNVSSPNTVGLRRLQARDALAALLAEVAGERQAQADRLGRGVPVLVKLAPDLTDAELDDALDAISSAGMDGVIATNTTISREELRSPLAVETGGLSGAPLRAMSTAMVRKIYQRTQGHLPIIGVGGIASAADAREKLDAGAALVQLYTGLIYSGPAVVKQIVRGLIESKNASRA